MCIYIHIHTYMYMPILPKPYLLILRKPSQIFRYTPNAKPYALRVSGLSEHLRMSNESLFNLKDLWQ